MKYFNIDTATKSEISALKIDDKITFKGWDGLMTIAEIEDVWTVKNEVTIETKQNEIVTRKGE